jgi:hypothetical protein
VEPRVALLMESGLTEKKARPLIGKWRKEFGEAAVMAAIAKCQQERASEPVAFIVRCLANSRGNQHDKRTPTPGEKLFEGFARAVESREADRRTDRSAAEPLLDGNDHPAMRQAQAEDWLEDMAEFSPADVQNACREWRQNNRYRPTPADIRLLAIAEERKRSPPPPPYMPEPERPPPTPEQIAYVEAQVREIKKNLAFREPPGAA